MSHFVSATPLILRPPQDFTTRNPHLLQQSRMLASRYAPEMLTTEEDLKSLGSALWLALGADAALEATRQAAGNAILPLIVESADAEIQALPWEALYHPQHGFLARHPAFTLSRRSAASPPVLPPLEKGPLRALLFSATPDNLSPESAQLDVEEEQAHMRAALIPWSVQGLVQLEMPDDGRFSTLKTLLTTFKPHLLVLSGHGKYHEEPHTSEAPYGEFFFEGEAGGSNPVRDAALAQAFFGTGVQALVFSACESAKAASSALNQGLAQCLSAQGIPHVIGMRESIGDKAAIVFAHALCDALAGQTRVDVALQAARAAIQAPPAQYLPLGIEPAAYGVCRNDWHLPALLSQDAGRPLIDWDFPAQKEAIESENLRQGIQGLSYPARFIGRRPELRQYKRRLQQGELKKLLITGEGGQGKTALAGKLALDLAPSGYRLFVWSAARGESGVQSWRRFLFGLKLALVGDFAKAYDRMVPECPEEGEKASLLLSLLMRQCEGRLLLILDNLEALQNPYTLELEDAAIATWLQAALAQPGLVLLATSRWEIPGWTGERLPLNHASYGDFLKKAFYLGNSGRLARAFLGDRKRLQTVYAVLGGNLRGLEFFAAALQGMAGAEEQDFLERLRQTRADLQLNLALAEIYGHLPAKAQVLLRRLPAYETPVPREGILNLGLDLEEQPDALLDRLLAVSLLETQYEPHWDAIQYQCTPLVRDWLREKGLLDDVLTWLEVAADYQLYLWEFERHTLGQAIAAHAALRRDGRVTQADRLALDSIVSPLSLAGHFHTLLEDWLPAICESQDLATRAGALNQTGLQRLHTGNFAAALTPLEQALAIYRQIGDNEGEGDALHNISQIYGAQGDYSQAKKNLEQALEIEQQIRDRQGEGATLNAISQIYDTQGDYPAALDYLTQALAIQQQIGDKEGEGVTLNNISQIYKAQGDYTTAFGYLKRSLAIRQQIGDIAGEGATLNNISQIYDAQGDYPAALGYLKQALAIRQQIGDKSGEGVTLNNISAIYHAQGDYPAALGYLKRSLAIRQQIGDRQGEGTTLNNISAIYHAQGDYPVALGYLTQALAIRQQIGDKEGEGATLNNISQIYYAQGDYPTTLDYLKQALAIQHQIGDKAGEGTTLYNISQIYDAQGDYPATLGNLKQSLAITQQIGDTAGFCATLFNIGHIHAQNKELREARTATAFPKYGNHGARNDVWGVYAGIRQVSFIP